jgi:hypothetical protein
MERYRRLSGREREALATIRQLAAGRPYTVWIDVEELLQAMRPDMSRDERCRQLASMKSRGIPEEGAGKWRAVW